MESNQGISYEDLSHWGTYHPHHYFSFCEKSPCGAALSLSFTYQGTRYHDYTGSSPIHGRFDYHSLTYVRETLFHGPVTLLTIDLVKLTRDTFTLRATYPPSMVTDVTILTTQGLEVETAALDEGVLWVWKGVEERDAEWFEEAVRKV